MFYEIMIMGVPDSMPHSDSKSEIARFQIAELDGALDGFQRDASRLPTTAEGLDALRHNPANVEGWNGPYIAKDVPLDP
jgi:general secretion pathway protein G